MAETNKQENISPVILDFLSQGKIRKAALLILILIVAAAAFLYFRPAEPKNQAKLLTDLSPAETSRILSMVQSKVTLVPNNELPPGFPKGFPLEQGSVIMQNSYSQNEKENILDSARSFASKKTISENFMLYKNFLLQNGYKITEIVRRESASPSGTLYAAKGDNSVLINIFSSKNQKVFVVIHYFSKLK